MAASLRARDDVEYAQPAYFMHTMIVPNDPLYKQLQWNLPLIDIERAWDIQPQAGSAITVAVIDTGIAYTAATITTNILGFRDASGARYPAIPNAMIPYAAAPQLAAPGRFVAPHDFLNNTNTPLDFDGHGTHVSGTIGQLTNDGIGTAGVAFNVKLMPLKVICGDWDILFGTPASRCGTDDGVAQAIRYAADNGARVINMSIARQPVHLRHEPESDRLRAGHRRRDELRGGEGRLHRRRGRQFVPRSQPDPDAGGDRVADSGRGVGGRGGSQQESRVVLQHRQLGGTGRAGRRRRQRQPGLCVAADVPPPLVSRTPSICRCRNTWLRAST